MNTEEQKTKKYKTSDIALAATLILYNHDLLYIEPVNKRTGQKSDIFHFVFADADDREQLVIKYSANHDDVKVSPNAFRATMRYLKEMTKNYRNASS